MELPCGEVATAIPTASAGEATTGRHASVVDDTLELLAALKQEPAVREPHLDMAEGIPDVEGVFLGEFRQVGR